MVVAMPAQPIESIFTSYFSVEFGRIKLQILFFGETSNFLMHFHYKKAPDAKSSGALDRPLGFEGGQLIMC